MSEPESNPFVLSHRTTVILLAVLPAVAVFALLMGIWHCIRKRNIAKRVEKEKKDIEHTLQQPAFLAVDAELPERSRSASHVPKPRLSVRTDVSAAPQILSASVARGLAQ
jgi:hypothetical protein